MIAVSCQLLRQCEVFGIFGSQLPAVVRFRGILYFGSTVLAENYIKFSKILLPYGQCRYYCPDGTYKLRRVSKGVVVATFISGWSEEIGETHIGQYSDGFEPSHLIRKNKHSAIELRKFMDRYGVQIKKISGNFKFPFRWSVLLEKV